MLAIVYYYLTFCIKSVCKCWIINSNPVIWAIGILANVHKEEHYLCCCSLVAQSCSTLCDPLDYSLLGLSVHGILQARILQWGGISLSRVSFWPRNGTCVSCFTGGFFTTELPGKPGFVCTHKKLEVWSWNIPTGDWLNASSIFWKTPRVKYYTNTEKRIRHICVYRLRRQWHPTPVLLPGKSHGWRSLVGCSPWGCKELYTTEQLHFHFSLSCIGEGNGNPLQCSCLENPRDGGAW